MKNLIVTLPAYNEERTIGKVIRDIQEVLKKEKYKSKILVIDDGSKDRTKDVASKAGATVFSHQRNFGLAETFRTEIKKCIELGADVIVHIDADGQYLPREIPKLLRGVEKGYDLVLGSRFKGKIERMPLVKRIGNKVFSRIISHITKLKISDAQTGFRALTREMAEKTEISSAYTYTQEQIIRAARDKRRILEVPVYFAKRGGNTKSRLMKNPFDFALRAFVNLLRVYRDYEPLRFFGSIGTLLFALGIVLGAFIIYNIIVTESAGGIPRVILSALLVLTGIQIWMFGFLADMHRK